MTTSPLATMPRADLRARLEAADDPKSRERTKVYPSPMGPPMVHHYSVASAAEMLDRFEGSTGGEIQRNATAHLAEARARATRSLRFTAAFGAAALGSVVALAAQAVPGPVGVVLTAASMIGTVASIHRYEEHDATAQDDRRFLAALDQAAAPATP